jgi:glycosyltransferase involved in cell wall biosynthesis
MISFIAALYNEEDEINDLINHIQDYVDKIYLVDDGSTDDTINCIKDSLWYRDTGKIEYKIIKHTGLPETVKNEALKMVPDGSWVIMLDADERFKTPLSEIIEWIKSPASEEVDYVYFTQYEIIDGKHVRTFQKCKVFRKESITFSTGIHEDDIFTGRGWASEWVVYHRKSTYKQIEREEQYVQTYKKLLDEGKIDEGRYKWLIGLHHYIKA